MRRKPILLEQTDTGCIIPLSHKLNADGYLRVSFGTACKWVREWKVQRLSVME